jgi:hypothetical protein
MMRKLIFTILALALTFAFVPSALAQGGWDSQLGQLRHELDRTDEMIAHAREAVRGSGNALAAQSLDRAVKLQEAAREAYAQRAYALALELTKKAREQAGAAISNSRLAGQLEGVVQNRLERAREILERAREGLPPVLPPTVSIMFEQARNNLTQAWQFYRQGQFRAALKLVEQVEQAAQRLQSIARLHGEDTGEFEHRLENVLRIVEHAREMVSGCDSDAAREHLRQAEEALSMARQLNGDGRSGAALQAVNRAREAARRAVRECQNGDQLRQRYEQLKGEADRLAEQAAGDTSPSGDAARELLAQAQEQLGMARNHLAEGKMESAQVSLQAAQLAIRQARRHLSGS